MKTPVCVCFSEALSAPEVAWSLVDAGFEVFAFARRGRRSALRHSRLVTVMDVTSPEADAKAALSDIERLFASPPFAAVQEGTIFPLDDAALWLCAQMRLPKGWKVTGPVGAAVNLALDKEMQVRSAQDAGLNVPETKIAHKVEEVLNRYKELPLVLRSAHAVRLGNGRLQGGRNWICATRAELERALSQWSGSWPLMVQPFIVGVGEGVFGFATDSGISAWSAHRRLRMMNPHGSGSSACLAQPVPEEIKPAVERLIQQTGWRGLFMVELLRDETGTLWFVEFNGRPWGSMALSRRQGFEYPAWAVKRTLNPLAPLDIGPASNGYAACRNAGREIMHFLFVLRGPQTKALKQWPSLWRTMVQLLCVRRGESWYNWRRDDRKVFWSDSWYTVRANLWKSRN